MESSIFRYGGREAFYQDEDRHYERNVVLLHGYSFNSDVWQKVGLYEALLGADFNVFGIDVPGFPNSRSRFSIGDEEMIKFLKEFADEKIEGGKLALLGSSASCDFALKFAERYSNALDALVLIGPAGISEIAAERIKARTMVVWGSEDPRLKRKEGLDILDRIKNRKMLVIAGAGHACYLDKPEEFNAGVVGFLGKAQVGK